MSTQPTTQATNSQLNNLDSPSLKGPALTSVTSALQSNVFLQAIYNQYLTTVDQINTLAHSFMNAQTHETKIQMVSDINSLLETEAALLEDIRTRESALILLERIKASRAERKKDPTIQLQELQRELEEIEQRRKAIVHQTRKKARPHKRIDPDSNPHVQEFNQLCLRRTQVQAAIFKINSSTSKADYTIDHLKVSKAFDSSPFKSFDPTLPQEKPNIQLAIKTLQLIAKSHLTEADALERAISNDSQTTVIPDGQDSIDDTSTLCGDDQDYQTFF